MVEKNERVGDPSVITAARIEPGTAPESNGARPFVPYQSKPKRFLRYAAA